MARREGVYVISVAAELAGMHPQTLRGYERKGLLTPERTPGRTRRYSEADIERLRRIHYLTHALGVNLSGARMILELEEQIEHVRRQMERMAEHTRRQTVAILPASSYRTLEQLWGESHGHQSAHA
jgi:MerR family transcriptional regulator/heat shock protein HspR